MIPMKLDKIDFTVLEMLEEDARISFREIARKLKVSPDTISKRFERLKEQGIIVDSTVVIAPSKIGYSFIARFGIDVKPAYSSQILGEIIKIPSVIVASKLVGIYDLVSIGVVKNFRHLCKLRDTNVDKNHGTMSTLFSYLINYGNLFLQSSSHPSDKTRFECTFTGKITFKSCCGIEINPHCNKHFWVLLAG